MIFCAKYPDQPCSATRNDPCTRRYCKREHDRDIALAAAHHEHDVSPAAAKRVVQHPEKRWVNFYPPCDSPALDHPWHTTSWLTRKLADHYARPGRIACVKVTFLLGEGLCPSPS